MAQPIAAPTIHKSPDVNLKFINNSNLPLLIIVNTPIIHESKPKILERLILSLKNITDKIIIKIGDEV